MESEVTSALAEAASLKPENNIVPFPVDKVSQLPSEKIEAYKLPREADMQTNDFLLYLPKGRNGFTFKTDRSFVRGPQKFSDAQNEAIRKRMSGQMNFAQGDLAKIALDKYRPIEATEDDMKFQKEYLEVDKLTDELSQKRAEKMINDYIEKTGSAKIKAYKEYNDARKNYLHRSTPNVGLRDFRISADTITANIRPIEFPVNGALASLDATEEDNDRSVISSTSGNVIFAPDKTGKRRLGVMLRSIKNGNWRKVPGTMIAGYFDGKLNKKATKESPTQGHRTLEPVDNISIFGNAHKELHEETGIEVKDVKKSQIVGFVAESRTRPHHEILTDVELKLTAEQAREKSRQHQIDNKQEFEEDWVDIEYSPEAIYTLLTQVMSPLPASHRASFAATGRRLVAETKGEKAAGEYMRKLELGINQHYKRMDEIVRMYLRDNPEVMTRPTANQLAKIEVQMTEFATENPDATEEEKAKKRQTLIEDRPKFNPDRFNEALLPEEQGLMDVKSALIQAGLIEDESNIVQFQQNNEQAKAA